jgi:hypothetical protein
MLKRSIGYMRLSLMKSAKLVLRGWSISPRKDISEPDLFSLQAQPVFARMGLFKARAPSTDRAHERGLYLPSGHAVTTDKLILLVALCKTSSRDYDGHA